MFRKWINKFLIADPGSEECDMESYLTKVRAGAYYDKLVFGISEADRGLMTANPLEQPGALFCGGQGSGKSIAMKFTVLTRLISNSDHDFFIMVDTLKGMMDYKIFFSLKDNVVTALNDPAKLIPVIDMVHAEFMARKEAFAEVGANNIISFEKIKKKDNPNFKLARIFICAEEFHSIPNSEYIKYSMKYDVPGTVAFQLRELMRIGRSYGITMLAATQRATPEDFPSSLKPGITNLFAFRVNNVGDAAAMNLPLATDIPSSIRGRCAYENGFMQFPWLEDQTIINLLNNFYTPLQAKMLKYSVQDFHTALAGEGNDGMVRVKPFKEILANISQYDPLAVFSRILEVFNFKITRQTNSALIAPLIAEKDDIKYAVLVIDKERDRPTDKIINSFKDGARLLDCSKYLIINFQNSSSPALASLKKDGVYLDGEDLNRIAELLDSRISLEEKGLFDELWDKLPIWSQLYPSKNAESDNKDDSDEEDSDNNDDDDDFDQNKMFDDLRLKLKL